MITVIVNIPAVNFDLLVQQVSGAGLVDYVTVMSGPNTDPDTGAIADPANPVQVTVVLADGASQAEQDQATAIVKAHNPSQMTAQQQAAAAAIQQMDTISAELATIIPQITALASQMTAFNVAADPTVIATTLNTLIPKFGQMIAGNAQAFAAIQLLLQQQGR